MFFQSETLMPGLTRIWDVAHTAMYLVEGEEKAVLIDTGVGVGQLKAVVDRLTDKPLTVLLTHGHVDHAMGAASFEDVRLSPLDKEIYEVHSAFEVRKGYVMGAAMQGADPAAVQTVKDGDYLQPKAFSAFAPLSPGDRFELGGVSVEVLEGAGHTPGSLTMLIPQWRVLLLGDACNQFTFLFDSFASPLESYKKMLLGLKEKTEGRYDRVLVSHGMGEGGVGMIDSVIAVCDEIFAGQADNLPFQNPMGSGLIAKAMDFQRFCRADGGEGNIIYNPQRLR